MRRSTVLSGLVLTGLPMIGLAEGERAAAPALAASPLGGGVLLETAGGLLLILVLIFGLSWLLRRFGRLPMAAKGELSIVSGVSLGPRERAVLLQVGTTRLLVGVAPGSVRMLHLLDEDQSNRDMPERFGGELESAMAERDL